MVRTFLKVYMELGSYFLFLQEQIKDIIIIRLGPAEPGPASSSVQLPEPSGRWYRDGQSRSRCASGQPASEALN
jgi:hypothetical protein